LLPVETDFSWLKFLWVKFSLKGGVLHPRIPIKAPGSTAWVSAVAGDRIEKDTLISTGFKSSAVILLGNSVLMVQPVTRLSLEEIIRN
jgi:hypothetical protein